MGKNTNLPYLNGDICVLPEQISQKTVDRSAKWFLNRNKKIIKEELGELDFVFGFLQELQDMYSIYSSDFNLFKKLPLKIQRYIATQSVIINEDPYAIVPTMPYTSYGYIVLVNGILEDTIKAFELQRLFGIRQLGFMMNPNKRHFDLSANSLNFHHTRGLHSIDVVTVLRLIEENNPNQSLNSNLLSIGGVSHDALTPAGGDTTKLINLKLFDEDTHYGELFKKPGWNFLKKTYHLQEQDLKDMILNKGIHGQLLDIADKIAYVARDTWMFVGLYGLYDQELKSERYQKIENIIELYPHFCDIWRDVKVEGNKMVIEDGFKLGIFLTVRALISTELYHNPASRYLEYMLSKRIINLLLKNKDINYKELLSWTDFNLEVKIWEFLGIKFYPTSFKKSYYKKFKSKSERHKYLLSLKKDNSIVVIPDDFNSPSKTGVDKYLVRNNGKVVIFKEAFPEMATEIEKIMEVPSGFGLYIISLEDLEVPMDRYNYIKSKLEGL